MRWPRAGTGLGKQATFGWARPFGLHQSVHHPGGLWEAPFFNECFCCENTEFSCQNGVSGEEFAAPASVLFSHAGSVCTHAHVARLCFYISVWGDQDRYVGIVFSLLLNLTDFHSSVPFSCLFYHLLQKCSMLGSLRESDFSRQQLKFPMFELHLLH